MYTDFHEACINFVFYDWEILMEMMLNKTKQFAQRRRKSPHLLLSKSTLVNEKST